MRIFGIPTIAYTHHEEMDQPWIQMVLRTAL